MLGNVYGLDLGTYEIKIFDKKKDRIWQGKETNVIKNKRYTCLFTHLTSSKTYVA